MSDLKQGEKSLGEDASNSGKKHRRDKRRQKAKSSDPRNACTPDEALSAKTPNTKNQASNEADKVNSAPPERHRKHPWFKRHKKSVNSKKRHEEHSASTSSSQHDDAVQNKQESEPPNKRRRTKRPGRNFKTQKPEKLQTLTQQAVRTSSKRGYRKHNQRFNGKPYAYAALDLGTNNCRLLIAIPIRKGEFRVVGSFSRIVRLGDGLARNGKLNKDAMQRAIDALSICAQRLDDTRIKRCRLIATEACRRAENGTHFLKSVKETTGIELEIVDRKTEARLAVSGCEPLLDKKAKGAVLFDIGGGSTEIALLDMRQGKQPILSDHIIEWTSLPVGVVTLADKFGGKNVTRNLYNEMVSSVEELIENFEGRHKLKELHGTHRFHLLGTSGTVTTLAGIHLKLERYDRRQVDGIWMNTQQINTMIDQLLGMDFFARQQNPCIGAERADLVLAGCAILDAIRNTWPSQWLRVADRGLREGLLMEMMREDLVWQEKQTHSPNISPQPATKNKGNIVPLAQKHRHKQNKPAGNHNRH